ncbi:AAA family ATPase [Parvibaculum sp.]|uniref:AAA family ATPase n=1 Tax=Parvibaculum sp. TaxID=2024848 RepID=UPI001B072AA7|nr:AAA family ATPase [Parvibaculum sp.]MBO6634506.1 AAA family ATPase [Parvibaculum sp.]MBO6679014.1 AAA family ATPase [Parvibaculum sp.]MBO6685279.1 AAA family ATPase [Parvibaculum sp.]MBO6905389.1 AAA family ATPase [Parvibaculum sp.]
MIHRSNFFIVTGGPGAGKTSLIEALAMLGYPTVEEAGRRIIREQKSMGGTATHDGDRLAYRELMFRDALDTFERMSGESGPVFFDRGLPDLIGYSHLIGASLPDALREAVAHNRYNPLVFLAPPWRAVYGHDEERKQDFAEAVATCEAMRSAYEEAGYALAELPLVPVEERVRFVLERVQAGGAAVTQSGDTPGSMPKTTDPSA